MNLAVLGRDVEDPDLLAPAAAIGIGAHDDGRAGLEVLFTQTVDQRLRDPEAFAFDLRWLTVGSFGSTIRYMCGFTQSNRATVPLITSSWDVSNMAWLWWANAGAAAKTPNAASA